MCLVIKLKSYLPLVTLSLGVFFASFSSFSQTDVAPYPYENHPRLNMLNLINRQISFYLRRIERSPDSALDMASLSNAYVTKSNFTGDLELMDKAEVLAKKSLSILPYYNETPKLVFALVAESRHKFPLAIVLSQDIYNRDKWNKGAITTLLTSSLGYGQIEQALIFGNILVDLTPTMQSYALRGLCLLAQGRNEEALKDFNKSILLEGPGEREQSSWVRALIGKHFYKVGNMDIALAYTNSALNVLPDYHVALAQKADVAFVKGDHSLARNLYIRAYKIRGEPPYLLALANLEDKIGNTNQAKSLRLKAENAVRKEIETTKYGHYNELAQILIDRSDPSEQDEAIEAASLNVEQRKNSESYFLLASALFKAGKYPQAQAAIKETLKSGESNCEYTELSRRIESRLNGISALPASLECPQVSSEEGN